MHEKWVHLLKVGYIYLIKSGYIFQVPLWGTNMGYKKAKSSTYQIIIRADIIVETYHRYAICLFVQRAIFSNLT